jgi:DNA-3-methyladenine glycosylase
MSLTAFFDREVTRVARELLGATLLLDGVGGIIVETEAYHPTDPASHSFRGPTPRNASMFAGPGRVYVYRSYGIHWCLNFVCGRGVTDRRDLCSGPGKLAQALAVTRAHDGLLLDAPPFRLMLPATVAPVVIGPRIGISKAVDKPWRFGVAGSGFLSRRVAQPAE